uniref:Uncharacterized protein n=1 Tax=Anguilla anguilla TaxID=7936 RepID=A0A0E9R4G9_ANGAN
MPRPVALQLHTKLWEASLVYPALWLLAPVKQSLISWQTQHYQLSSWLGEMIGVVLQVHVGVHGISLFM